MKIGIIGYGYVGKGMERLFSAYETAHYDIVTQPDHAVLEGSDLILICVPTPEAEDGTCDLSAVADAAKVAVKYSDLICIKSAVSPGTTDRLNKGYDNQFTVSPEYLGEGKNYVPAWDYPDPTDSRSHDFVIVGGPKASQVLDIFQSVMATTARYIACRAIEAELCKRMENAFFAVKVSFCNEMAKIAESYGIDYKALRELWLMDSRVGRSHTAVFADSKGFGGKCLPKDLSALIHEAQERNVNTPVLKAAQQWDITRDK